MFKTAVFSILALALGASLRPAEAAPRARTVVITGYDLYPRIARDIRRATSDKWDASKQYYLAKDRNDRASMTYWREKYGKAFQYVRAMEPFLKRFPVTTYRLYGRAELDWARVHWYLRKHRPQQSLTWHVFYRNGRLERSQRPPDNRPTVTDKLSHPWYMKMGVEIRKMIAGKKHLGYLEATMGTIHDTTYIFVDSRGRRWSIGAGTRALVPFDWNQWKRLHVLRSGEDIHARNSAYARHEFWRPRVRKGGITVRYLRR